MSVTPRLVVVLSVLLSSAFAGADPYLVFFKDQKVFEHVSTQVRLSRSGTLNSTLSFQNLESPAIVSDELKHLKALIIDSDSFIDLQTISQESSIAWVESEIVRPAPRPFRGGAFSQAFSSRTLSIAPPPQPWGIKAVKAPGAWAQGARGQNVKVAVLDTGVDREHPALKANFLQGKDFIGESGGAYEFFDADGHGSHVAGTILGGQLASGFVGVAPQARLLAGKVCSLSGCPNIAVAKGIDWAIATGADVVNLSLGGDFLTNGEALALKAAEQVGVVVVAATGNDGVPKVGFPAALETSIAVGAVDVNLKKADFSQWGPELDVMAPGVDVVSSVPQKTGREMEVSFNLNGRVLRAPSQMMAGSNDAEQSLQGSLVNGGIGKPEELQKAAGKLVLIARGGGLSFKDKARNAIIAGATAVVVSNNEPGLFPGSVTDDGSKVSVPVILVEQNTGATLKAAMDRREVVSASLKTVATDYSSLDGTSMATPHVTGVVALLLSVRPDLTPAQVRSLIKQTASSLQSGGHVGRLNPQTGAGLVNAEKLVTEGLAIR
jgi:serine protease